MADYPELGPVVVDFSIPDLDAVDSDPATVLCPDPGRVNLGLLPVVEFLDLHHTMLVTWEAVVGSLDLIEDEDQAVFVRGN